MDSRLEAIYKILEDEGYRLTNTRKVLIYFFLNEKEHLRIKEIHEKLRGENISIASIYRNVEILEELGIVSQVVIHNEAYYELKLFSHKRFHLHFSCIKCGKLKEYTDSELIKRIFEQKTYISQNFGDEVMNFSIVYEGICSECKDAK